jgi:hypothetical protein
MPLIYAPDQLKTLLEIYTAGTGVTARKLGLQICDNHMVVSRILAGLGSSHRTAEALSIWLSLNWPTDLRWPAGVARLRPGKEITQNYFPMRRRPQRNPARLKSAAVEASGAAE